MASVSATDADGSAPNNAIFFVLGLGGSGNFRVDSTTGEVTVALESHLDRDTTPAFNLTVLVLDRGDPPRSSNATVTVTLTDINDEPPEFNELQSSRNISENAPQGMTVAVMRATDRDSNPDLMYEIVQAETEAYNDRGTSVNINSVWVRCDFTSKGYEVFCKHDNVYYLSSAFLLSFKIWTSVFVYVPRFAGLREDGIRHIFCVMF